MRETVFRERQEKVAFLEAIGKMVSRVLNFDSNKMFGGILAGYAEEVFQETYDADLLRLKAEALRRAHERIKGERQRTIGLMNRLDRMGQYYDQEYGPDLKPLPRKLDPLPPRVKPSSR